MVGAYPLVRKYLAARARTEEAIREGESRVRLLLDSTGEGIYGIDLLGLCTFVNAAAAKMLGYDDAKSLLGRNMHDLVHHTLKDGSAYPVQACPIYKAFRSGESVHSDDEIFWRSDGTSFPVEYRSYPILNEGARIGAVVTFVDIGGRRRAEETVRLRDRALRSISQGIVITDPSRHDNPIVYANATFEQITGYSEVEVLGRNCRFLQGADTDPGAVSKLREAVDGRHECSVELLNYRKDGTPFWNALSLAPIADSAGRVTHFVGVQTDITRRKEYEEEVRRSEERLRSLVEATSAIVWNTPTAVEFVNEQPAWAAFTGQDFEHYRGKGWLDAVHPADREPTALAWRTAEAHRSVFLAEQRLRRADGEYRNMQVRVVPIVSEDGAVREWVGVHTDITEQKRRRGGPTRDRAAVPGHGRLHAPARLDGPARRPDLLVQPALVRLHRHDPRADGGLGLAVGPRPRGAARASWHKFKAAFASGEPWEDTFPLRRHDGEMRLAPLPRPARQGRAAAGSSAGSAPTPTSPSSASSRSRSARPRRRPRPPAAPRAPSWPT